MNCFTFRKLTTVVEKIGSRPFEFGRIITFTGKARHNAWLLVILRLEFFCWHTYRVINRCVQVEGQIIERTVIHFYKVINQ